MANYQYQSFPDAPGMVDSFAKLKSLQLPPLIGKSFLDVGCNEGYYCGIALWGGSTKVVGIDSYDLVINRAQLRYPQAAFLNTDWNSLPDGKFDIILFASSLHYLPDRESILKIFVATRQRLAHNGLLIIETGIADGDADILVEHKREDGLVKYPTMSMLAALFDQAGLTWRPVGQSIVGDGIRRTVFHCRKRQQCVLIVRGEPGSGKSYFSRAFLGLETDRLIQLDLLSHVIFQRLYPDQCLDTSISSSTTEIVRRAGVSAAESLVDSVLQRLNQLPVDRFENKGIIIEGLSPSRGEDQLIFDLLQHALIANEYLVWDTVAAGKLPVNEWTVPTTYVDCGGYLLPRAKDVLISVTRAYEDRNLVRLEGSVHTKSEASVVRCHLFSDADGFLGTVPVRHVDATWFCDMPNDLFLSSSDGNNSSTRINDMPLWLVAVFSDNTAAFPNRPSGKNWPFAERRR